MDSDQITGKAKETFGKAEAAVGSVTGDHETEASGRVRQAAGAAQDIYGQAKDSLGQAKDSLKDNFGDTFADATQSAEKMLHSAREAVKPVKESLEREVNTRPLIALLIAALVGFVLAQLTTS